MASVSFKRKFSFCEQLPVLFAFLMLGSSILVIMYYFAIIRNSNTPAAIIQFDEYKYHSPEKNRKKVNTKIQPSLSLRESMPRRENGSLQDQLHNNTVAEQKVELHYYEDCGVINKSRFDCEVAVSLSGLGFSADSTLNNSLRYNNNVNYLENISKSNELLLKSGQKRKTFDSKTWCGRALVMSNVTGDGSFSIISRWLSSGGLNVMELLHKSVIQCPLQCPSSVNGSSSMQKQKQIKQEGKFNLSVESRISKMERDVLDKVCPVMDYNLISNYNTSRITYLNSSSHVLVGDLLHFRIDLYNGYRRLKKHGGDEVRVWISDHSLGAGVPGKVTDLKNGSYLAEVTVRWEGKQNIHVALHHPRELVRTMVFLRHSLGTMRYLTSSFENKQDVEFTLCMWYPIIPGYIETCDLTVLNGGLPWYCGKPLNRNLTCKDWARAQSSDFISPLPVTTAEEIWLDKMSSEPYIRAIPFQGSEITARPAGKLRKLDSLLASTLPPGSSRSYVVTRPS